MQQTRLVTNRVLTSLLVIGIIVFIIAMFAHLIPTWVLTILVGVSLLVQSLIPKRKDKKDENKSNKEPS